MPQESKKPKPPTVPKAPATTKVHLSGASPGGHAVAFDVIVSSTREAPRLFKGYSDGIQINGGVDQNPAAQAILFCKDGIGSVILTLNVTEQGFVFGPATRVEIVNQHPAGQADIYSTLTHESGERLVAVYACKAGGQGTVQCRFYIELICVR